MPTADVDAAAVAAVRARGVDDGVPMALFDHRPVPEAMTSAKLAALVEHEVERSEQRRSTLSARDELGEIGQSQQLLDQAFVQQAMVIVAAHNRAGDEDREFVVDELALALGIGTRSAMTVLKNALGLAALPGMLEAIRAGMLTQRHALAVLHALDEVPQLQTQQRVCIATIVIARLSAQTPHELATMTRSLILSVDLRAAQHRRDAATTKRHVRIWSTADGQAVLQATGPVERIAAIKAALQAWRADNPREPDDLRSEAEREFDLVDALLSGGEKAGSGHALVIVPFSTAGGGELELAEIPGFGSILPSTARQLLVDAEWCSQVAVDERGAVISVGDPVRPPLPAPPAASPSHRAGTESPADPEVPAATRTRQPHDHAAFGYPGTTGGWGDDVPWATAEDADPEPTRGPGWESRLNDPPNPPPRRHEPADDQWLEAMRLLMAVPPPARLLPDQLGTDAYRTPKRLRRYLEARDDTCVFPGCHQRITDVDHRVPWPRGGTEHNNTQLLCRRHHRAKQRVFTVELTPEGHYVWTTRGGWQFLRERRGF